MFECQCGCGAPVAPGIQFVIGHDMKLRSQLFEAVRSGERATSELFRRGWPMPAGSRAEEFEAYLQELMSK